MYFANGETRWVNPENAYADDINLVSTGTLVKFGGATDRRRWTGFGFDTAGGVPVDAVSVDGIEVEILDPIGDDTLSVWIHAGTVSSPFPANDLLSVATRGGLFELWGLTPTPYDVRIPAFGVELRIVNPNVELNRVDTFNALRCRINYTAA
jgi:hypothetical protein